jgi:hypothetical protein
VTDDALYRSPADATSEPTAHTEGSTFPAGTALATLFVWFILARPLTNLTARHPWLAKTATFMGVFGAVLAALALVTMLVRAAHEAPGSLRILHAVRALVALPVTLLVFAALLGEPHLSIQWAGLIGAGLTVAWSSVLGVARSGTFVSARMVFASLLIGELIELGYAPAQAMLPPEGRGAVTMAWLGRTSELCTLLGSFAAARWAYVAATRAVGAERTRLFLPFPVALTAVIVAMIMMMPTAASAVLARTMFGARFDLVSDDAQAVVGRLALFGYALAPALLLAAATLSTASIGFDHGAGARRSWGWLLVFFAGFGVLRLAGPMDPIRLVMVALATVLLEQASAREPMRSAR